MAFLPLSTANLPDPAIDPAKGSTSDQYFDVGIWTGDGVNGRTIADLYGHTPDWVWIKNRSAAIDHNVADVLRGFKELYTNLSNAEGSQQMNAPTNDGLSGLPNANGYNNNGNAYVSWAWKAGTSFSNDASATGVGTIDSTGSVSTEAGFSIVSYTGTGSAGAVAHSLGAVPSWIIVKNRDSAVDWAVYHSANTSEPETEELNLNKTDATEDKDNRWNDTAPTSSVFSVGNGDLTNKSGDNMIAYCFSPKEGYSKFSSYVGNGSTDGPFVYTGFNPAFVLFKKTDITTASWAIRDNTRYTYNPTRYTLYADKTDAEYTGTAHDVDFLSNGFKPRTTDGLFNSSGATYIYMAFAEQPFKFSNAR